MLKGRLLLNNYSILMGNLHVRLTFNPGGVNKIFYHCSKEHRKISRIAKFGGEMLQQIENIASQNLQICIYLYYARKKLPLLRQFQLKNGNLSIVGKITLHSIVFT